MVLASTLVTHIILTTSHLVRKCYPCLAGMDASFAEGLQIKLNIVDIPISDLMMDGWSSVITQPKIVGPGTLHRWTPARLSWGWKDWPLATTASILLETFDFKHSCFFHLPLTLLLPKVPQFHSQSNVTLMLGLVNEVRRWEGGGRDGGFIYLCLVLEINNEIGYEHFGQIKH